jgi:hypothetical protein
MDDAYFSDEFRARLQKGKYTQWAEHLTEEELAVVLWYVGELGLRPLSHYRALGAVQVLKKYVRGRRLTKDEAHAIVHGGAETEDASEPDES